MEDVVPLGTCVERYGQDLEEGLVTPELGIEHSDFETDSRFFYELVWNGMVLECGRKLEDLVVDHGMSVDEPVVVTVILKESPPPFRGWTLEACSLRMRASLPANTHAPLTFVACARM